MKKIEYIFFMVELSLSTWSVGPIRTEQEIRLQDFRGNWTVLQTLL